MKLIEMVMKLPYAKIGIPAFLRASKVLGILSGTDPKTTNRLVKSILPPSRVEMSGITMSLTRESTIFPNAPPMMTPTARSITFPLTAKALNSFMMLDVTHFSLKYGLIYANESLLSGLRAFYLKIECLSNSLYRTPLLIGRRIDRK